MKNFKSIIALTMASSALLIASSAQAKTSYYGGVGVETLSGTNYTSVVAKGGAEIANNFGVEAEVGHGLNNKDYYGYKLGVGVSYAVYGTYTYPIDKDLDIVGRIGYGGWSVNASTTIPGYSYNVSASETGIAAGVTVRKFFNGGKNGIRIDGGYIASGSQFGIGYIRKF